MTPHNLKIKIIARNNYSLVAEQNLNAGTWSGKYRPLDRELICEIFDLSGSVSYINAYLGDD